MNPTPALIQKPLPKPDKSWTLFLDRDGVINQRVEGDYIRMPEDFHFLPGVIEGLKQLRPIFGRIVVVTNQQGIGKGLMTEKDLEAVHEKMTNSLASHGVMLDGVYHCPHLAESHPLCRKPMPGMALEAQADFPDIHFHRSIMVGDSESDIQFGQRLGMFTIKIGMPCGYEDLVAEGVEDIYGLLFTR